MIWCGCLVILVDPGIAVREQMPDQGVRNVPLVHLRPVRGRGEGRCQSRTARLGDDDGVKQYQLDFLDQGQPHLFGRAGRHFSERVAIRLSCG